MAFSIPVKFGGNADAMAAKPGNAEPEKNRKPTLAAGMVGLELFKRSSSIARNKFVLSTTAIVVPPAFSALDVFLQVVGVIST